MPLVRVELPWAKLPTIEQRWASMWRSRSPLEKRFQIFTEHAPGNLVIDRTHLGIDRSADAIVVQVTLNEGRDTDAKRSFYRTLAEGLRERVGPRPEDLVVNLVEVKREKLVVRPRRGQLV
jgi:4-oxalocrotonate tautomerase